jgi:hypothetical protein
MTSWFGLFDENSIYLAKEFPSFMELKHSHRIHKKKIVIGPRFEPNGSSPHPPNANSVRVILIISYRICVDLPSCLFP